MQTKYTAARLASGWTESTTSAIRMAQLTHRGEQVLRLVQERLHLRHVRGATHAITYQYTQVVKRCHRDAPVLRLHRLAIRRWAGVRI
jgi:hypothetical protein